MKAQETGLKKYMMSLNKASIEIWNQKNKVAGGAAGSAPGYERAAKGVSDINHAGGDIEEVPGTCDSIAGQFLYYYNGGGVNPSLTPGSSAGCPKPIGDLFREYFAKSVNDQTYDPTYYSMKFSWKKGSPQDEQTNMMTAYTPGPFTGVGQDGTYSSPIPGANIADIMRRNFYSTKFITLDSLQACGGPCWDNAFPIMSEGKTGAGSAGSETQHTRFANPINPTAVDLDLNSIKY
jgi:hypothetical protein